MKKTIIILSVIAVLLGIGVGATLDVKCREYSEVMCEVFENNYNGVADVTKEGFCKYDVTAVHNGICGWKTTYHWTVTINDILGD